MTVPIIVTPGSSNPVIVTPLPPTSIQIAPGLPTSIEVEVGTSGPAGGPGPEGGTPVVPIPYDDWPPVDPVPDTLYLRLAP